MANYRVKIGTHVQEGRTYHQGDVVESDTDLIKLFPEKFVLAEAPVPKAPPPPTVAAKEDVKKATKSATAETEEEDAVWAGTGPKKQPTTHAPAHSHRK